MYVGNVPAGLRRPLACLIETPDLFAALLCRLVEKREQPFQLRLRRLVTVLTDLIGLGMLDRFTSVLTVPLDQRVSITISDTTISSAP